MIQRSGNSATFTLTGDVLDESPQLVVKPERDAVAWLQEKLGGQDRRIGEITYEWCGPRERPRGTLEALMDAKNTLKLMSYVGRDGKLWWELPEEMAQKQPELPIDGSLRPGNGSEAIEAPAGR